MSLLKPCVECGELTEDARCSEHAPQPVDRASTAGRGYDSRWRRLSERARRQQPWCSDCGARDDLTTDHTPRAWARVEAGLPIRLQDVVVVCRGCNSRRGAARGARAAAGSHPSGASPRGEGVTGLAGDPTGSPSFGHTPREAVQ